MPASHTARRTAELLITNVTVWVGQHPRPAHGWLALGQGRIQAIGTATQKPPPAHKTLDGHNSTILPSFVDCHSHISAGSIASICRKGAGFRCREDALQAVRQAATEDPGEWLVFFYVDWDAWDKSAPPSAEELEEASGGRPVILVCESLHRAVLSESGLRACKMSQRAYPGFVDTRRGRLTGVVWEEAFSRCLQQVIQSVVAALGSEGLGRVLLAEANRHLAYGITDAHDPCVSAAMSPAMQQLNATTPLRISWSEVGGKGPISSADGSQQLTDFGDGPSSAKVFTDGAHRCAMCIEAKDAIGMTLGILGSAIRHGEFRPLGRVLQQDLAFKGGRFYQQGALFQSKELTATLRRLDQSHERIKIHALGNHAVDMTCDCIIEAGITTKVCLEHATIVDDQNIEKMARHGFQVSAQPGFLPHFGDQFRQMHLTGRYRGLALRSMVDAGVDLILSSDYPCGPLDPLHNLRCAVDRTLPNGRPYLEQEAISPEQAVFAYTNAALKGIGGQAKPGLVPGAPADLVILSGDPFAPSTTVQSTWINGQVVYQATDPSNTAAPQPSR